MLSYLTLGIVLGVTAGLSPGPMMTLVITQSIRYGTREGVKLAIAPLLSDLPIVVATWLLLARVAEIDRLLGVIALTGAALLLLIAAESWRANPTIRDVNESAPPEAPRSLIKGALANLLNPHPWLFWLTIGSPTLVEASTPGHAAGFLTGFYGSLVGAKLLIASLVGHFGQNLRREWYRLILRGLAIILALIAIRLIADWGRRLLS